MIGIDLFAGVGGMSTGAAQAGIDVKFAVESDKFAANAYRKNHPHCEIFVDDIRRLSSEKIKQIPHGSDGTVVFGGPPCQGFSYSNTRTRGVHNENNWLFEDFARVVEIWQPDFVVFENVRGIIDTAKGLILKAIIDRFDQLGYMLSYGILNALNFGVPQKRSRFFLIGSRTNKKIELPRRAVSSSPTVQDAIADLPRLVNGAAKSWLPYSDIPPSIYAKKLRKGLSGCSSHLVTKNNDEIIRRYRFVPPGGNWENIPPKMMKNYKDRHRCHTGIYYRLRYDRPSIVIGNYRKNMLIHPSEDRGLSVREAARIQSFSDSYEFAGSIGFQQQQVGNAVPPQLAKAVFGQLHVR
ncbi:MAG: DNA cytosine methyltransferase [Gemmatimonadetes bacterium]|nr:DNA cytosine methyltransferase [Gemmatimonadota bacterium]